VARGTLVRRHFWRDAAGFYACCLVDRVRILERLGCLPDRSRR